MIYLCGSALMKGLVAEFVQDEEMQRRNVDALIQHDDLTSEEYVQLSKCRDYTPSKK